MEFTHFIITQDGGSAGSFPDLEQAAAAAARRAADTGKPVTVTAHTRGGGSREAVFNPDGTNERIWNIDKGRSLSPTVGEVYVNRGGGRYRCLTLVAERIPVYYNQAGGSSGTAAVFRNVKSGWTFTAKGIIQYVDGSIEWDHSCGGRFEDKEGEWP